MLQPRVSPLGTANIWGTANNWGIANIWGQVVICVGAVLHIVPLQHAGIKTFQALSNVPLKGNIMPKEENNGFTCTLCVRLPETPSVLRFLQLVTPSFT